MFLARLGIVCEGVPQLAGAPVHDGQQFVRVGLRPQLFQARGGEENTRMGGNFAQHQEAKFRPSPAPLVISAL